MLRLTVRVERWPIAGGFRISRGSKADAEVVVVELGDDETWGWGESVPYRRYGESVDGVVAAIEAQRGRIEAGMGRDELRDTMASGAARNALDLALWDLEAQRARRPVWELLDRPPPQPVTTAFTVSLGAPETIEAAAVAAQGREVLKLKLGGDDDDLARVVALRRGAPYAKLIVDANEALSPEGYRRLVPALAALEVDVLEQPLPAGFETALAEAPRPVAVCADESFLDRGEIPRLSQLYDLVNVKLDKAGGLTEALDQVAEARAAGLGVMVGCMVATSLAVAPALLLAADAAWTDLDGALLLERDRPGGLVDDGLLHPGSLWGVPR